MQGRPLIDKEEVGVLKEISVRKILMRRLCAKVPYLDDRFKRQLTATTSKLTRYLFSVRAVIKNLFDERMSTLTRDCSFTGLMNRYALPHYSYVISVYDSPNFLLFHILFIHRFFPKGKLQTLDTR